MAPGDALGAIPIRQDVVPLAVGYGLTMLALGVALWASRRDEGSERPEATERRAWGRFVRYLLATAIGGWALLMAVVLLYYVAVAGQGHAFLFAAFTGTALMAFGIGVPSLLLIAWVADLVRHRRRDSSR